MKKTKVTLRKATPILKDGIELRRWCIENAIRWPTEGSMAGVYGAGGGQRTEADVIGRAKRLLAWITEPHS